MAPSDLHASAHTQQHCNDTFHSLTLCSTALDIQSFNQELEVGAPNHGISATLYWVAGTERNKTSSKLSNSQHEKAIRLFLGSGILSPNVIARYQL